MRKYATFDFIGRGPEGLLPEAFERDKRRKRTSDWYCHADDVSATLEAKDREIAKQRAVIVALQLERGTWECRFNRAFAGWERSQNQVDRLLGKLEARQHG